MAATTPNGHSSGRLVRKRLSSIKPSPENFYDPTTTDDPNFAELVESIAKHGLHEPLILTADGYIVSGHRRHCALMSIGQQIAPCRVLEIRRDSMTTDEYTVFIRDHNRHRDKSAAEMARETMVDIDPEEAHRHLRELRDKSIRGGRWASASKPLAIEGSKTRHGISQQKAEHVKHVKQVVFDDRRDYWPLSVRGVHYALLNYQFLRNIPQQLAYKNDDHSYHATSDLITRLRLIGEIPWQAIDDGTRPLTTFRPFSDVRSFVRQEVDNLFGGYWRDLLQSQPNHVECVVEKNTIYHMALRVTSKFQIPTSSGRGFNSIDPWHDLYERYIESGKDSLIIILLADYDPEGEMIPHVGGRTLRDDFGAGQGKGRLEIIKAGVTRDQIDNHRLPSQNFAKETSSNFKWFVGRNGGDESVYELEALDPAFMLDDLEKVIQSVIDVDLYNREAEAEQNEAAYLEAARKTAIKALRGLGE